MGNHAQQEWEMRVWGMTTDQGLIRVSKLLATQVGFQDVMLVPGRVCPELLLVTPEHVHMP